ncbi:MAG: hypothetical protein GY730_05115 [bacterium]|nr:hypothetical protein [bacterium]
MYNQLDSWSLTSSIKNIINSKKGGVDLTAEDVRKMVCVLAATGVPVGFALVAPLTRAMMLGTIDRAKQLMDFVTNKLRLSNGSWTAVRIVW